MPLVCLDLTNWCQFERLVLDLHPGINAIVGPNRRGKSNALAGLRYAMFGSTGLPGVLDDNIRRYGTCTSPTCSVELSFTVGRETATIRRSIRPRSQRLQVAGQSYTDCASCDSTIASMLGLPSGAEDMIFASQWEVFRFLLLRPQELAKTMTRLAGIERMESIYQKVGDYLARSSCLALSGPAPDVSGAQEAVAQAERDLEAWQHRLASLPDVDEELALLEPALEMAGRRAAIESSLVEARRLLGFGNLHVYASQQFLEKARADALSCPAVLSSDEVQALHDAVDYWHAYTSRRRSLERIESELASLAAGDAADPAPQRPNHYVTDETTFMLYGSDVGVPLAQWLARTRRERDECERFVQSFSGDTVACPVCGTASSSLVEQLPDRRSLLVQLSSRLQAMEERVLASKTYDKLLAEWSWRRDARASRRDGLVRELQQLSSVEMAQPQRSLDELKSLLAANERNRASSQACARAVAECEAALASDLALVAQRQADITRLESALAALPVQSMSPSDMLPHIVVLRRQRDDRAEASRMVEACTAGLARARSALEKAVEAQVAYDRRARARARIEKVRTAFHWDAGQRDVATAWAAGVVSEAGQYLATMGSPYVLKAWSHSGIEVVDADGRPWPVARLSGGEKVIVALSLRVAIALRSGANLLVLDEPTDGLDDDNLACVQSALAGLRGTCATTGLQVVMVTHRRGRADWFDRSHDISLMVDRGSKDEAQQ